MKGTPKETTKEKKVDCSRKRETGKPGTRIPFSREKALYRLFGVKVIVFFGKTAIIFAPS